MRDRCGVCTSPPAPCGTSRRRSAPTRRCSPAGTERRSSAGSSSRRRRSKRGSSPARTRMRISHTPSRLSTRRSPGRWVVSVLAAVAAGCARPTVPAIGAEPEVRIGLAAARPSVALGGEAGGELILTDDATGQLIGSIPAGARWTVVPDPTGVKLLRPDGTASEPHRGIFAVNVTEGRFAVAEGRGYRGRLDIVGGPAGILLVNRVPVESYVASVIAAELGPRRSDELAALLAQAIVSRTFALRNRGRWEALGLDAYAEVRDQVYGGVERVTAQA